MVKQQLLFDRALYMLDHSECFFYTPLTKNGTCISRSKKHNAVLAISSSVIMC